MTAALGMLGAISAEALLGLLLEAVTWREAFNLFALVAVAIGILMWMLIPRNQAGTHSRSSRPGMRTVVEYCQGWPAS